MPTGSARQRQEAVYADQRRLAGVPQPLRAARAPRAPGEGPLLELLGLQQPPRAACGRARARRAITRIPSTSTATAATSWRSVTPSGTTGRQLWSHDAELDDHADGIAVGNFSGDPTAEPQGLRLGQRRGVPDVRPPRHDPEARADRPRADRQRRQVPPRPARAATDVHQLLEEPRHRLAVRPRRQPPGPAGADPFRQPDAAGELARRRPGVRPALGQHPRGGDDRRARCAGS